MTRAQLDTNIARAAEILRCAPEFVARRMAAMSIGMDCKRCGGAGHYSRNAQGSTRCYDCKGTKLILPSTVKAWNLALVQCSEAVEDGRLARYEQSIQAARALKTAQATMAEARAESGIHGWAFDPAVQGDERIRRRAILTYCDKMRERAENAIYKLGSMGVAAQVDATIAAMAMVDAAVAAYNEAAANMV